jgi:hypothetical protein
MYVIITFPLFVYLTGFITQFAPGKTQFTPEQLNDISDVHSCG